MLVHRKKTPGSKNGAVNQQEGLGHTKKGPSAQSGQPRFFDACLGAKWSADRPSAKWIRNGRIAKRNMKQQINHVRPKTAKNKLNKLSRSQESHNERPMRVQVNVGAQDKQGGRKRQGVVNRVLGQWSGRRYICQYGSWSQLQHDYHLW